MGARRRKEGKEEASTRLECHFGVRDLGQRRSSMNQHGRHKALVLIECGLRGEGGETSGLGRCR